MSETTAQTTSPIIDGVIAALVDPCGLTEAQHLAARRDIADAVVGFEPAGTIQIILAGQCVIFDRLLRGAMHDVPLSDTGAPRSRARRDVMACGKMFQSSLDRLRRLQGCPVDRTIVVPRDAKPAEIQPEPVPIPAAKPVAAAPGKTNSVPRPVQPPHAPDIIGPADRLTAVLTADAPPREQSARSRLMNGAAVSIAMPPPANVAPAMIRPH